MVFKLQPNKEQATELSSWIDMLFCQYNYNLRDRNNTYWASQEDWTSNHNFPVTHCALTCCISRNGASGEVYTQKPDKKTGLLKRRNAGAIQDANLKELKKSRPWYKRVNSTALQQNVKRLDNAFDGFFGNGKGRPKPKRRSKFKSFTITNIENKDITSTGINIKSLGWVGYHNSHSIPDGFVIKSATIRQKADGWYISLKVEDNTIPQSVEVNNEDIRTVVGCDLGLTKLVHISDGSQIDNPRFNTNKKVKQLMWVRSRRASRKKGKSNKRKAYNRVGRLHKRIKQRRESYQWQVASKIAKRADAVVLEDLNIKGMSARCRTKKDDDGNYTKNGQSRKVGLNRSIADASWYSLTQKINVVAAKSGVLVVKVAPQYTSQKCSHCGHIDKNSRDGEKFICTNCGHFDHADLQAARNIKNKGIEQLKLPVACQHPAKYFKTVRVDCSEPKQLR
ncbi:RNA-guided endonuclease InsQ/TnpB family protein, partial [Calothrix sp. CCY 0018]|uniref:RNA-guided endonuclease InsQ/TnpB family protein n=1 Tax=Calothrix sp. CCY 0018 TaxID=3103864 RepID=UPI0039C5F04A